MTIRKEILGELLKDVDGSDSTLFLVKVVCSSNRSKTVPERTVEIELDNHLGYEKPKYRP
jgi:hypothetical protein